MWNLPGRLSWNMKDMGVGIKCYPQWTGITEYFHTISKILAYISYHSTSLFQAKRRLIDYSSGSTVKKKLPQSVDEIHISPSQSIWSLFQMMSDRMQTGFRPWLCRVSPPGSVITSSLQIAADAKHLYSPSISLLRIHLRRLASESSSGFGRLKLMKFEIADWWCLAGVTLLGASCRDPKQPARDLPWPEQRAS